MTEPRLKPQRWWSCLLTLVPREEYLKAARLAATRANALHGEQALTKAQGVVIADQKVLISALQSERTEIRASLLRLPEYEGLVGPMPLAPMVAELARDYEELTSRIEGVLDLILTRHQVDAIDTDGEEWATLNQITGLLQGQIHRVPDTLEGITDGED